MERLVLSTNQLINHQPISEVRLIVIPNIKEDFNNKLQNLIWWFLSSRRRLGGDIGGNLRPSFNLEDLGMEKIDIKVTGLDRRFYVYIPSNYSKENKLPLVVTIHGYTSDALEFAADTEWWRVAEERNFICIFAQAYPTDNLLRWNNILETAPEDSNLIQMDIDYFIEILKYME